MFGRLVLTFSLVASLSAQLVRSPADTFLQGITFAKFIASAQRQQDRWREPGRAGDVPVQLVNRLAKVSRDLQFLVVAEDWCPDSANTIPFVVRLAAAAGVDVRIVNRATGRWLLEAHRTPDGRTATPVVALLRDGQDVGAWIERPAPLQQAFNQMLTSADAGQVARNRQAWYERDRGRSALSELVALAEETARGR